RHTAVTVRGGPPANLGRSVSLLRPHPQGVGCARGPAAVEATGPQPYTFWRADASSLVGLSSTVARRWRRGAAGDPASRRARLRRARTRVAADPRRPLAVVRRDRAAALAPRPGVAGGRAGARRPGRRVAAAGARARRRGRVRGRSGAGGRLALGVDAAGSVR